MQVTINYDPHNADDMAKLAEMFGGKAPESVKPSTIGGQEAGSAALDVQQVAKAFRGTTAAEAAEATSSLAAVARKITERQEAEAEENVDLNTVKTLAIEAIKAGKRDAVLAKLKELGAPTVTKLPAKHFVEMHKFLTELMADV